MSLWRKRNVQHNGQNQPKWFNMTALANNDLSIKSEDLSIKSWVGLTDEERNDCLVEADPCECLATPEAEQLMIEIEAKLKEKNA